jgi:hypothetical protein
MKRDIPWSSVVGFLLLLALGIGIPFWMEYRSLVNPPSAPVGAKVAKGQPSIQARKGYYCGNCGGNTTLPEWSGAEEKGSERSSPLSLESLRRPAWETPKFSTSIPSDAAELREDP